MAAGWRNLCRMAEGSGSGVVGSSIVVVLRDGSHAVVCGKCQYPVAALGVVGDGITCPECGSRMRVVDVREGPSLPQVGFWMLLFSLMSVWLGAFCAGPYIFVAAPVVSGLLALGACSMLVVRPPVTMGRRIMKSIVCWVIANAVGMTAVIAAFMYV